MISWLFVKDLWPGLPSWVIFVAIPVAIIVKSVANWTLGYLWDRRRLFDAEATWANERNVLYKNLNEKLLDNGRV